MIVLIAVGVGKPARMEMANSAFRILGDWEINVTCGI